MARLLYQGHSSIRIISSNGKVCYIDPFAGEGYELPADLVLITHEHYDHNAIDILSLNERTITIRSKDSLKNGVYYSFDELGFHIEAMEAYNSFHERDQCVGYLITVDGITIYHAGDTGPTEMMKTLGERNIDYALLPIDGHFTMTPEVATKCCDELIKPKHLIPIHMHPGLLWDWKQDMKVTSPTAMLVKPGDEILL